MHSFKRSAIIVSALVVVFLAAVALIPAVAQTELDQEKLDRGAQIYRDNCAVCHGENGEGRVGATLAQEWPSIRPDLTVRTVISNGVQGSVMPAWSEANGGPLSEAQIDDVTYFILSWSEAGPPPVNLPAPTPVPTVPALPGVAGDPTAGAVLYAENCEVCHGPNGSGRVGATLAQNWPSIRPDLTVRNVVATGIQGSAMPAWSQANGGPLTEAEVDNVTAYVLTFSPGPGGGATETTQVPVQVQPGIPWFVWLVALVLVVVAGIFVSNRSR
jgi:mono/diheme cytochrome c family protein